MARTWIGWAVGAGTLVAVVLAVQATRHTARPDGSPIDPAGGWRTVWIVATIVAVALAGIGVLLARRGYVRLGHAVVIAVVIQLVPFAGPLLLSQDVYLYWAEARVITVHHQSPYDVTPSQYPNDPGTQAASLQWRTQPEPYGPVWATVGTVPALAAGSSKHDAQLAYRLLAALGVLLTVALIARRTRSPAAVVLLGWSPLIALHYAGGGHSDALLTLALVGAVALGASLWGGAAWPFAALFKAVPVVVLPLELARRRLQVPRSFWIALVGSGVVLTAIFTAAYGTGWMTASAIAAHGTSPIGGVHFVKELTGLRHRYDVVIAGLVFVVVYLVLLRVAWRTGRAHLGFALAALCMCSSLLRPWYALWPLALAAYEEDGLSMASAYALAGYVLFADAVPALL